MKAKIIKSTIGKWYEKSIGDTFDVKSEMFDGMYVESEDSDYIFLIDPQDCTIIPE